MVSVTSASRFITSVPHQHPRYQSRSSMYIRGLIPRNFAELAESVPIEGNDLVAVLLFSSGNCNTFVLGLQCTSALFIKHFVF